LNDPQAVGDYKAALQALLEEELQVVRSKIQATSGVVCTTTPKPSAIQVVHPPPDSPFPPPQELIGVYEAQGKQSPIWLQGYSTKEAVIIIPDIPIEKSGVFGTTVSCTEEFSDLSDMESITNPQSGNLLQLIIKRGYAK
jgi:hypothetical protein